MALRSALRARTLVHATLALVLLGGGGAAQALAQVQAPQDLVAEVIGRVLDRLEATVSEDTASQEALQALFEEELSPHLAFGTITHWVAGERWERFSAAEREELMGAVRTHIVRVYAALLARGRTVEITIDQNAMVKTRSARVAGLLETPEGGEFKLEFRLLRGEDAWMLFDLLVDGLSFTRSLRAELQPIIEADGIAGVRAYLAR